MQSALFKLNVTFIRHRTDCLFFLKKRQTVAEISSLSQSVYTKICFGSLDNVQFASLSLKIQILNLKAILALRGNTSLSNFPRKWTASQVAIVELKSGAYPSLIRGSRAVLCNLRYLIKICFFLYTFVYVTN